MNIFQFSPLTVEQKKKLDFPFFLQHKRRMRLSSSTLMHFSQCRKEKPFLLKLLVPLLLHYMSFLGSSFRSLLLSTSSEVLMKCDDPKTCFMLSQIILSI